MVRLNHMIKYNGEFYKAGEEDPRVETPKEQFPQVEEPKNEIPKDSNTKDSKKPSK